MLVITIRVRPDHQQTFLNLLMASGFGPFTIEITTIGQEQNTLLLTGPDDMALPAFLDHCEAIHLITVVPAA